MTRHTAHTVRQDVSQIAPRTYRNPPHGLKRFDHSRPFFFLWMRGPLLYFNDRARAYATVATRSPKMFQFASVAPPPYCFRTHGEYFSRARNCYRTRLFQIISKHKTWRGTVLVVNVPLHAKMPVSFDGSADVEFRLLPVHFQARPIHETSH
jgi:hypothetical protein